MTQSSSEINARPLHAVVELLKEYVEKCGWIWVEAQVIEIRRRAKPTQFLTLRDHIQDVSVSVTCSAMVLDAAGPLPEGSRVLARITPRIWKGSGSLNFECSEIQVVGEGQLLAMLEQRKRLLQAEGLFDPVRKKPIPFLPRKIGLITGADSAAERDVLQNVYRRWPAAEFVVQNPLVQGPTSAVEVMAALAILDAIEDVDVIVIARGGGSLEDLLPFSDEGLVRAVAACRTPVVSAIGHEPDNPILDLVADLRASTPTDAAKRIVPDAAMEAALIGQARERLSNNLLRRIQAEHEYLEMLLSRPVMRDPLGSLSVNREQILALQQRAQKMVNYQLSAAKQEIGNLRSRALAMSPQQTLERGYAIVTTAEGETVTTSKAITKNQELEVRLHDGHIRVQAKEVWSHND